MKELVAIVESSKISTLIQGEASATLGVLAQLAAAAERNSNTQ